MDTAAGPFPKVISLRKVNPKAQVSSRYSPEVIAHFKATDTSRQTRMDEAQKEWIAEHSG